MIPKAKFQELGNQAAAELGKKLIEDVDEEKLKEMGFTEDNTMSNSTQMYTTALAKAVWYKSYDMFKQYYDSTIKLTPADVGMPEGAGAYKLPKVLGSTAAKLASGEVVDYVNDNKDEVTLETETYGIGTRINRRIRKRAAKGFVQKLMKSASDAVQRAVVTDIANGMVAGASSDNTDATGIDYDAIENAKYNIKEATTSDGVKFGFMPDTLALSNVGFKTLAGTTEFKNVYYRRGAPSAQGEKALEDYPVWQGLKVKDFALISSTKNSKAVHGIVFQSDQFMYFLQETGMDTFDGRLPGTAGDEEIILAVDAGMVVANAEAGAVITAS